MSKTKPVERTKYQKFEMATMRRSEIKAAPFNPRIITDSAKKKLKGKMKSVGLLQPIVINSRTGNLVSGHQRLATLDDLERGRDFDLDVSVIDIDEKEEKEMIVFFNNQSAQGEWDLDKLAELNLDHGITFDDMGFDKFDVEMLFDGDSRFTELFVEPEEVKKTDEEIAAVRDARSKGVDDLREKNSAEFYFVVVCNDKEQKDAILRKIGGAHV